MSTTATTPVHVTASIWVCPTPGCGNYFGSKGQEHTDLTSEAVVGKVESRYTPLDGQGGGGNRIEPKHTRAECPDCRGRGLSVERVMKRVTVAAT